MKLKELLKDIEIIELGADLDLEIADICYDSRLIKFGDVFVAISGLQSDGHKFIESAVAGGAACIVCENPPQSSIQFVRVSDCRKALSIMSRNYFGDPASSMCMIGVTGTNGKTTSTMLIKHMLEESKGLRVGLIGTNQNMIQAEALPTEHTTPESYELQKLFRDMRDKGCTHVVMEVSSHSLELSRVYGIHFAVGIFTNLTQDHLDFHGTMDEYAKSKSKLFSMCDKGVFNIDDEYAVQIMSKADCDIITCSVEKNEADLVAKDLRFSASRVKFCALTTGELERVQLGIPGRFSVYNALSVIACGLALGFPLKDTCETLRTAKGVKGRVEVVKTDGDYTILIDYAHTPDALLNVLKSMKEITEDRVVILFGCGGDRDRTKRPIMGKIAAEIADFVIVTSDNPRTEDPSEIISEIVVGLKGTKTPHVIIQDRREAITWAIDNHKSGDLIILAGKGHETYQIIGKTKYHMDEREIVADHLEFRRKAK